jgi:uncharacterized membrane protein YqjE
MEQQRDDRSLGELFSELSSNTSNLVRQEINLAKAEMTQKATEAGRQAGMIGVGGVLAHTALLALVAALVAGLGEFMPIWASALLVGIVLAIAGYFVIRQGLDKLKQLNPKPEQTIETLKEDKEWIKDQTR